MHCCLGGGGYKLADDNDWSSCVVQKEMRCTFFLPFQSSFWSAIDIGAAREDQSLMLLLLPD
jgi:hypothetical protein